MLFGLVQNSTLREGSAHEAVLKHVLHLVKGPRLFFKIPSLHALDIDLILVPHSFRCFSLVYKFDTLNEKMLRKCSDLFCDELATGYISRP